MPTPTITRPSSSNIAEAGSSTADWEVGPSAEPLLFQSPLGMCAQQGAHTIPQFLVALASLFKSLVPLSCRSIAHQLYKDGFGRPRFIAHDNYHAISLHNVMRCCGPIRPRIKKRFWQRPS
jgi:hypothetical protein